ncbi:nuclear transport factor 2 family protein [Bacillus safensis]|uniref:nuclear transport factor 2 family protein n=1 Tax=Bacillus safensis TaxID=561879 RepID=UPI00207541C9|nr:nuclear transport factor 2 family protein [Bacillus safensis]USD82652.1 nuclear transport factor 2 family protein [Bacillus safensis]
MDVLDTYFRRYDEVGRGEEQLEELLALFSDDVKVVINGDNKSGIQGFTQILEKFFHVHEEIKHMWDGWIKKEDGKYETNWAVCGKLSDGRVYTAEGIDIAELDDKGKIVYFENVRKNPELLQIY